MNVQLERLLNYLAGAVDPRRHEEIAERHRKALSWEAVRRLPVIACYPCPADTDFEPFAFGETQTDYDKMLYNELVYAFGAGAVNHQVVEDDQPWTVRPNFGTVVMASRFGGKVVQRDNEWPWVEAFSGLAAFEAIADMDPYDYQDGLCPQVIEAYECYRGRLRLYPELQGVIRVVLPDLQGPLDTAEMLRGSLIFRDFYDHPNCLEKVLSHLACAQVGLAKHLQSYVHEPVTGFTHQHGFMMPGHILIRNDSSIMISAEMYRDHVAPHDEYVLREMGGGGIHSCGRMEHLASEYLRLPGLKCLDLGQPGMNDVDGIYRQAQQRMVSVLRLRVSAEELLADDLSERFATGASIVLEAAGLEDAGRAMAQYRGKCRKNLNCGIVSR